MRPVLLDMDGFASFRDQATVDFTDTDYFALVGPTGSGKSTVIDAMTFALYGTVPRWQDKRMVMYALAPTAVRGTVRLVFDVERQRYVVARELRRTKQGVQVKSARLERLLDPTAIGSINDLTDVMAADGLVTAAVEKLLGLSFEHFCQCVVLPQGEFAEFLRAKGSDRREILLKLLGAGLYREIGREANSRASLAGQRATLLGEQMLDFIDATPETETLAAERVASLVALTDRVDAAVPALRAAAVAVEQGERRLEELTAEHLLLTSVRVPDGVTELDGALTAQQAALTAALEAERSAAAADVLARQALSAAPDRGPLEEARRGYVEQRRILTDVPAARADVDAAVGRLQQAGAQAEIASTLVETSRSARDAAAADAAAATSTVARLVAESESLGAVALPAGLDDLGRRGRTADRALQECRSGLEKAEMQDLTARAAVRNAPRRAPLERALQQLSELATATAAVAAFEEKQRSAAADRELTQRDLALAIVGRDKARGTLDKVSVAHGAAALRPHLIAGESCPVCEQVVTTLPPPLPAAKVTAAEKAVATAEAKLEKARAADASIAQLMAAIGAQLASAEERVAAVRSTLEGHPTDSVEIQHTLDGLDRLDSDAEAADQELREARAAVVAAQAAVRQVDMDASDLRRSLQAVRDPLVALGAPVVDGTDLLAAWSLLTEWAGDQLRLRRQAMPGARAADDLARELLAASERALAEAQSRAAQARKTETEATGAQERARAGLRALQTRLGELTTVLFDAPSEAETQASLAQIDELASAVQRADGALQRARTDRQRAEESARALDRESAAAWQALRRVRDSLIALGAPELPDGPVLSAWTVLGGWAVQLAESRAAELPRARAAAGDSANDLEAKIALLETDFAALDVTLPSGDITDAAAVAAATALNQARAELARIGERRRQAARLIADRDAAVEQQQVAGLLGNLLRSNQFPEWLEAAALDTLVADASLRLADLSNGQFELTHRNGEFFVVDHADADSQRGVRTLSGGETFQASLALALALSTQLSSMAAAGAARLDSIFLDEGFGTLDESTLEIVAATLESLAQGDRMVGVVTHVAALAERVPVRYVVNRDSRTSTIVRETV